MDIQAPKPVSGAVTPAATAGKDAAGAAVAAASQDTALPVEKVPAPPPPPAQNLLHTQKAIAEQVSRYLHSTTRNLEFQVDSESGNAVIVVRDAEGHVIRRIPGEEALQRMLRANADSGTLIDSSA